MIEVIILTSANIGVASVHMEELLKSKEIKIKSVVLNQGLLPDKKKHYKRKLAKSLKIGLFGVVNGIRMRKWYASDLNKHLSIKPIDELCEAHNIPFHVTPSINSAKTIQYFKRAKADLGLSLGNGYIGKRVFSIPRLGMINIHHEELPAYQNAQSIIWQLYNNSKNTAYTIHKIDKHIDSGGILLKEMVPIEFKPTLGETVSYNYAQLWKKSSIGLVNVLERVEFFFENIMSQEQGQSYTTPSFSQFLRIKRNFTKLRKELKK